MDLITLAAIFASSIGLGVAGSLVILSGVLSLVMPTARQTALDKSPLTAEMRNLNHT